MATARARVEAALKAKSWTTVRTTSTSLFATKASPAHALFAIFNAKTGQLIFTTYDGARFSGSDIVGQLITKINAS